MNEVIKVSSPGDKVEDKTKSDADWEGWQRAPEDKGEAF